MSTRKSTALRLLDKVIGEPETLGRLLWAHREGEEWTQAAMAKKLGVSVAHLSDIENGRRLVSPERAARFAVKLGAAPESFVALALQDELRKAGLKMRVRVETD